MLTNKVVAYSMCEACNKVLKGIEDGVIIRGMVVAPCATDSFGRPLGRNGETLPPILIKPLIGKDFPEPGTEDNDVDPVSVTAWCWTCLLSELHSPLAVEFKEFLKARDASQG